MMIAKLKQWWKNFNCQHKTRRYKTEYFTKAIDSINLPMEKCVAYCPDCSKVLCETTGPDWRLIK